MSTATTELKWFLRQARPRRRRSLRAFAEAEIVIPTGPFAGRRFRCSRQPYTGLWFDEVDSGYWNRCVATGPTQSGKTLSCFVIPLVYHLFEIGETVICGLPHMDMAADKWREDIFPVVEATRFRELLPRQGGGSRGGRVESIQFLNGATLKFMSGGGGDKSRAGFTSRVVVITETDGLDESGGTSREADKITQLEARTRAYGNRKRIYLECTVSTEEGRTWREYQQGTASRIVLFCPYCGNWVSPEREHLVGWKEAATQKEASTTATFACPSCNEAWSEQERIAANQDPRLLHRGQSIDDEHNVTGPLPPTDTLGFRWSAVNNLFLSAGELGADEWRASRSPDEDNAERAMRQFVWCLPVAPSKLDETQLEAITLAGRMGACPRGIVPADCQHLTLGIDLGKYLVHWIAVAWADGATGHVVDYGRIEVASGDLGVEKALMVALRELRDMATNGWPQAASIDCPKPPSTDGTVFTPDQVWIDAGYMTEVVYAFCRESRRPYFPCVGRGADQQRRQWYNRPTSTGSIVKHVGEGFHINWLAPEKLHLVEIDTDHWKTWLHQRLAAPLERSGTITFHKASPNEHLTLAKHLTAETKTEEFVAGKGVVVKWERIRRQNHWLDALGYACAAASLAGVRLIEERRPQQASKQPRPPRDDSHLGRFQRPDGSPWIDFDRWGEMSRRYLG